MHSVERSRSPETNVQKPMGISSVQPFWYLAFALANVGEDFEKKNVRPFFRNNLLQMCLNRQMVALEPNMLVHALSYWCHKLKVLVKKSPKFQLKH